MTLQYFLQRRIEASLEEAFEIQMNWNLLSCLHQLLIRLPFVLINSKNSKHMFRNHFRMFMDFPTARRTKTFFFQKRVSFPIICDAEKRLKMKMKLSFLIMFGIHLFPLQQPSKFFSVFTRSSLCDKRRKKNVSC